MHTLVYFLLSAILVSLQVWDVTSTNKVLNAGGSELNPIPRWFQKQFGKFWWVFKLIMLIPIVGGYFLPTAGGYLLLGGLNVIYLINDLRNNAQLK
jgi:hypothetical protein